MIRSYILGKGRLGKCLDLRGDVMKKLIIAVVAMFATGCATIVNDPNIPLTVSFSDGSGGKCTFKNKRGTWSSEIPATNVMIRRSDDALNYDCATADGRQAEGSIASEMEGGKMAASVIFWDLGITDSITDKHRTYQGNVVIPVPPKEDAGNDDVTSLSDAGGTDTVGAGDDVYTKLEKLSDLKDRGIISEEEFDAEKKKLLDKN
jgi:hypothetical protein